LTLLRVALGMLMKGLLPSVVVVERLPRQVAGHAPCDEFGPAAWGSGATGRC
jgi:hypothetical protein